MLRTYSDLTFEFFQNHPILKKHITLLDHTKRKFRDINNIFFIRVPGRVNLIGEHIDYNNGPVLPCAIDREIILCLTDNTSGSIRVSNVNPDYKEFAFSARNIIEPYEKGHWGNYIKAGVKGIVDYLGQNTDLNPESILGFDAIISSTLPAAAGLSSSSTLVVGAALAILIVNQIPMDKLTVAEICAEAEHFVGTSGGGMDHAACLLGKKDSFLKIEFNPLKAEPVSAPDDIEIILFHSLVDAEKSSHVREEYNRRVLECLFGPF
jgi:galactokinase